MTLANIAHALRYLDAPRSFAMRCFVSAKYRLFDVRRLGPIALPIDTATAKQLIARAKPSPFGLRQKTLHDPKVRSSWEIEGKQVRLGLEWMQMLHSELDAMRDAMQLPDASELNVELDKLLIYERGQFFLPHQDSEKCDGMIGTLVVVLPSAHAGGDVVVEHRGERVEFRRLKRADKDLTLLAFYADCRHEVRPVTRGYRVALTFRLVVKAGATAFVAGSSSDALQGAVRDHFEMPPPPRFRNDVRPPADHLVYLLDHQYTKKGLGWSRLKGADRARVAALRQVGEALDCHVCLALADVHEVWGCEEQDWGGWYRGHHRYRGRDDFGEVKDADDDERTLSELQVSEVALVHGIDVTGKPVSGLEAWASSDEVCCTTESVKVEPYKADYEPYMGNYGNTVDRWYHRAAVVMWPRARDFAIRAKASLDWGFDEILGHLEAKRLDDAQRLSGELVPLIHRGGERRDRLLVKAMRVAVGIAERDLASQLLERFGVHLLRRASGKELRSLHDAYGLDFCIQLLEVWQQGRGRGWTDGFVPDLTGLVEVLTDGAASTGLRKLARLFVERQWEGLKPSLSESMLPARREYRAQDNPRIIDLLHACEVTANAKVRTDVLRTLKSAKADFSPDELVRLAGGLAKSKNAEALTGIRKALLQHAVKELRGALAKPERKAGDWSLPVKLSCSCELCRDLSRFLSRADQSRLLWPLAKERRAHLHGTIESHCLPVEHVTHRRGSPYTLVLTKSAALREREAAQRSAWRKQLKLIEKQAGR